MKWLAVNIPASESFSRAYRVRTHALDGAGWRLRLLDSQSLLSLNFRKAS